MKTNSCTPGSENMEFTCYGTLVYRKEAGNHLSFSCTPDENGSNSWIDPDCTCSMQRDFNLTCRDGMKTECSSGVVKAKCAIPDDSWNGKLGQVPSGCETAVVDNSCNVQCTTEGKSGRVSCQNTITCNKRSPAPVDGNTNIGICRMTANSSGQTAPQTDGDSVSIVLSDISSRISPTSTTPAAPDQSRQTAPHTDGNSVSIALGVVTGLAILALIVTLVLVLIFRRRQRGRKTPSTEVYVHMNTSDVGSITYESCSNAKDRQSEMYMDIDEAAILKSDPTSQPQSGTVSAPDSVYNTIDDGYAQTDAKVHRSQDQAGPDDVAFTSASYFVLEKPNERITGSSQRPTTDLNTSENYFVLDKDDTPVLSNIEGQDNDRVIVQPSNADNYFVLEEQANEENNENAQPGNYFLLEEENKINRKEGNPTDDAYNTLNSDINNDKNEPVDDYSHARGVASSQENTTRETNLKEDSEDYDKLFQNQNNNIVYDSDNDYDHMNTADL